MTGRVCSDVLQKFDCAVVLRHMHNGAVQFDGSWGGPLMMMMIPLPSVFRLPYSCMVVYTWYMCYHCCCSGQQMLQSTTVCVLAATILGYELLWVSRNNAQVGVGLRAHRASLTKTIQCEYLYHHMITGVFY